MFSTCGTETTENPHVKNIYLDLYFMPPTKFNTR